MAEPPKETLPTSTAAPAYKLKVGYNMPWYDYGADFGPIPGNYSLQDHDWLSKLGADLATLKSAGVEVVRWFILANGFNYGFRPDYRAGLGLIQGDPDLPVSFIEAQLIKRLTTDLRVPELWSFNPPDPPDPRFAKNFEQSLQIFRAQKMQFIPSLIDKPAVWGGKRHFFGPVKAQPDAHDFSEGGRYDIVNDPNKRSVFLNKLFDPLLTISETYKDVIYAWEVMSEPTYANSIVYLESRHVTEATLRSFLDEGVKLIEKHNLPSTVGHRFSSDLQKYPTGNKPQFHYYPNKAEDALAAHPGTFVGEFAAQHEGQFSHGLFDVDQGAPWPILNGKDKDPDTGVQWRLQKLEALRFELALIWPDLSDPAPDSSGLKISKTKLAQIRKFTSGIRI